MLHLLPNHLPSFDHPKDIPLRFQIMKLFILQFPAAIYFLLLDPDTLHQQTVLRPQSMFFI
jgi:hypothetical protein